MCARPYLVPRNCTFTIFSSALPPPVLTTISLWNNTTGSFAAVSMLSVPCKGGGQPGPCRTPALWSFPLPRWVGLGPPRARTCGSPRHGFSVATSAAQGTCLVFGSIFFICYLLACWLKSCQRCWAALPARRVGRRRYSNPRKLSGCKAPQLDAAPRLLPK